MKKIILLVLIFACSGCFFDSKETLNCSMTNNIGEVSVVNEYEFIYKKDEIDGVLINMSFDCKKDNGRKIYETYIERYSKIGNLSINTNDNDCIITIKSDLKTQKSEILDNLNLSFLKDTNITELKAYLKNTEYQC